MNTTMSAFVVLLAIFVFCFPLYGQVATRQTDTTSGLSHPLVTAQASSDHIRFTALTIGSRMRLEVLSPTGDTLFDSTLRPGNLVEWPLADQQGSRLSDGVYGCIVRVEDMSGRVTYRRGLFRLADGKAVFDAAVPSALESASVESGEESIAILGADDQFPFTFVGHDESDGRIESTSGGLIFQAGRFYAGAADQSPHMRLTPEGNLGIGVREPQAKLEVAGLIRASEGFQFSDGTVLRMENGYPVLVTESTQQSRDSSGDVTAKPEVGIVRLLATKDGGPGRVYGNEIGSNTLYGEAAGSSLTTGKQNSFFGFRAGTLTSGGGVLDGDENTFLGASSGAANTIGWANTFVGSETGSTNSTGSYNSFVGRMAGHGNTVGHENSFFGIQAGRLNTTGSRNSFYGGFAGESNSTGDDNSFFGYQAGTKNTSGFNNAFFGRVAGVSNTIGGVNSFFGDGAGYYNTVGSGNSFFGFVAGNASTTGSNNSFFGANAGRSNTIESFNASLGSNSDVSPGISGATALGNQAKVTQSNSLVLGSINGVNNATADTKVGIGTTAPDRKLQIASSPSMNAELHIGGPGDEAKDVFSGMGVDLSTGPALNFGYSGFSFGRSSGFFNVRPDASAIAPNPSLRFLTANQQRMIITNAGNVGIGTIIPPEKLTVDGNLMIQNPGNGVVFPDGTKQTSAANTIQVANSIQVWDAIGTQVGQFAVSTPPFVYASVFLIINNRTFPLSVYRNRFYSANAVYFENANCTGTPYINSSEPDEIWRITVGPVGLTPPGQTVYLPQDGATFAGRTVGSVWVNLAGPVDVPQWECQPGPYTLSVIQANPLVNLNTMFTAPFKVGMKP